MSKFGKNDTRIQTSIKVFKTNVIRKCQQSKLLKNAFIYYRSNIFWREAIIRDYISTTGKFIHYKFKINIKELLKL